ncbi:MAG: PAS domain S-box protein, partial [Pseudomonadota bacterium]
MANPLKSQISSWIWTGFLLILGGVVGLGVYVVSGMNHLQSISHDLYAHSVVVSNNATEARVQLTLLRNVMLQIALAGNPAEVERLAAESLVLGMDTDRHIGVLKEKFLGDAAQVVEVQRLLGEWAILRGRIIDLARQGQRAEAVKLIASAGGETFVRVDGLMDYIVSFSRWRGETYTIEAEQEIRKRTERTWALLATLAALIGLTGFAVVRRVAAATRQREAAELDLRHNEERLRAIFDSTVDAIVVIDTRGLMESVNPAANRMFGHAAEEMLGQNVSMLMPEPDRGWHDGYLQAYLSSGQAKVVGIGREVVGQRQDGSLFPILLAVSETLSGDARLFVGVVRDISVVKKAERELVQMQRFFRLTLDALTASICVLDET